MIDRTRTAGNLFFYEHPDRCRYLGKSARDQSRWLEENPDKWVRIEDVRQEDAPGRAPVEAEKALGAGPAEPSDQTSSNDVRQAGDALAGDFIPPAKGLSEEPNTETTPRVGRKRGQRRNRQPENEKKPSVAKAGRMLSPERMRIVLDSLRERPLLFEAARNAGIYRRTLEYWRKRSAASDAGYDIEWQGVIWRFHEHCETAMEEAEDTILAVAWDIANGKTVPEASRKQKGKMLRLLLEWKRPDKWGKYRKIDVPENTGVLIVGGNVTKKPEYNTTASVRARRWKALERKIRQAKS